MEAEYEKILASFLPPSLAHIIADAEAKAADGELDENSYALSQLIGHNTATLAEVVAETLKLSNLYPAGQVVLQLGRVLCVPTGGTL